MEDSALILEGGGFRGLFTTGALEFFMAKDLRFPYVIGVSMGACNGASYISNQPGRNYVVNTSFIKDKRYMSYRRWFTQGEFFGMNFIFNEIPRHIVPFDFDTYLKSDQVFKAVVTDINTGKPVYIEKNDGFDPMDTLKASASLPLMSKPVWIDGKPCLDGGISDSIPIEKPLEDGYKKLVVVLTQPRGYEKTKNKAMPVIKTLYKKYPKLVELLEKRHENYNTARQRLFELEKQGRAFIIEPDEKIPAGRIESDPKVLKASYDMGYNMTARRYNELMAFVK